MSDETKGATEMVQGCKHDNVTATSSDVGECDDCPVLVSMTNWRRLHPPPEPPKSWVDSKSDGDPGKKGLMRETIEECCRQALLRGASKVFVDEMRRAMLEPKP